MAIVLDETTFDRLVVLPQMWDELDVRAGIVAREWEIDGIVDAGDAAAIQSLFTTWSTAKAAEPTALSTGTIGATVAFSGAAAGQSWDEVPCWFSSAPSTPRIGGRYRCSFRLVDAAQALAADQLQERRGRDDEITYGTYSLAGVTLTLLEQPEVFTDGPTAEPTAAGTDVIRGALIARELLQIRGYTTSDTAWGTIKAWYAATIATPQSAGNWFPVSPPTMTKERVGNQVRVVIGVDLRRLP
jgi:hypothetical protein